MTEDLKKELMKLNMRVMWSEKLDPLQKDIIKDKLNEISGVVSFIDEVSKIGHEEKIYTLKELINASGGPARCADIWGVTRQSVSGIIKRNSISIGLLEELQANHLSQSSALSEVLNGETAISFRVSMRKPPRSKNRKPS